MTASSSSSSSTLGCYAEPIRLRFICSSPPHPYLGDAFHQHAQPRPSREGEEDQDPKGGWWMHFPVDGLGGTDTPEELFLQGWEKGEEEEATERNKAANAFVDEEERYPFYSKPNDFISAPSLKPAARDQARKRLPHRRPHKKRRIEEEEDERSGGSGSTLHTTYRESKRACRRTGGDAEDM